MLTRTPDHVYMDGKVRYLSVTQQLATFGLVDFSMIRPADLEHARQRGQFVHQAVNMFLYDVLNIEKLDHNYKKYVEAYIQFQEDHGWEVYSSEEIVFDETLKTAGAYDQIGKRRNTDYLALLDIKATVSVSATVKLQTAAYQDFYNQDHDNKEKVMARGCLQLLPTGKYKLFWYKDEQDISIFKSICRVNWWALSNGIIPLGAKSNPQIQELCKSIINGGGQDGK